MAILFQLRSDKMKKLLLIIMMLCSFGFVNAQTIQSSNFSITGYIKSDGTIQNSSYSTVGYVNSDGKVQNSRYSTIGYIKDDGKVQNSSYSTIGYAKGVKKQWAAVAFFFFKFN